MNERIRELAEQANANELSYAYYRGEKRPENAVTLHSVDLEKFAELVVRECAELCMKKIDTGLLIAPQAPQMAKQIREHFGVEE